jgi:hypothetical protein
MFGMEIVGIIKEIELYTKPIFICAIGIAFNVLQMRIFRSLKKQGHLNMMGKCDECGEKAKGCRCVEGKLRDEVDMLHDTVVSMQWKLGEVTKFINNPQFREHKDRLDRLEKTLLSVDSNLGKIMDKCEDNMRRLNHMMLEMKGIISQASAKAHLFVPKKKVTPKD